MTMLGTHGRAARRAFIAWGAALAAAVIAAGCGSSSSDDEPSPRSSTMPAATSTVAPTRTSTTPRTSAGAAKAGPTAKAGRKRTGTATTMMPRAQPHDRGPAAPNASKTPTTTAPAKRIPTRPAKVGKPQTFSGTGDRLIGSLSLERNAVVRWTVAGGGAFTVRDATGRLKISGHGSSGQSFAASGDYRSVKVTASGRWTLSFASLGA
jgi:hypothetical protein